MESVSIVPTLSNVNILDFIQLPEGKVNIDALYCVHVDLYKTSHDREFCIEIIDGLMQPGECLVYKKAIRNSPEHDVLIMEISQNGISNNYFLLNSFLRGNNAKDAVVLVMKNGAYRGFGVKSYLEAKPEFVE